MLSFEENHWNFKAIEFFSSLNLLPIEIDTNSGEIRRQSKKWRLVLWKIQFVLEFSHWIFTVGRLIQSLDDPQCFKADHFVLHVIHILGVGFCLMTSFHLFWSQPGELVIIFNDLYSYQSKLSGDETGNEEEGKIYNNCILYKRTQFPDTFETLKLINFVHEFEALPVPIIENPRRFYKFEYSVHELLALLVFPAVQFGVIFGYIILAFDTSRVQFLYSVTPKDFQSIYLFFVLFLLEFAFLEVASLSYCLSLLAQLLFFQKLELVFSHINQQLR